MKKSRRNFIYSLAGLFGGSMLLSGCKQNIVGTVSQQDVMPLLGNPESFESTQPIQSNRPSVKVSSFGGDIQSAIYSLPADGGIVEIDQTIYLSQTIDVPRSVEIFGTTALPGSNSDSGNINSAQLEQRHILVANGVSPAFRLHGASGLNGVFLHKDGVSFGDLDSSHFADMAVQIAGEDVYIEGCFITGFHQAAYGSFVQRSRITNNRIDCVNGIWLERVFDIARVNDNHLWPFVTVSVNTPESAWREGVAFRFSDGGDWNHLRGNFCFGFATGYLLHNVEHVTAVQCGADSFQAHRRGIGFHITGKSKNIALIACQSAGQRIGFYNETEPKDKPDQMIGCSHWGNKSNVAGWN